MKNAITIARIESLLFSHSVAVLLHFEKRPARVYKIITLDKQGTLVTTNKTCDYSTKHNTL